ncbi:MAG: protein kinase [Verrucomicrobiales bacterium]|nr:protein kinase [Verrucomicrobiales bacterium]
MSELPPPVPEYTLLRPVGRGAYGEVWLARSVTGVHRAVKIVHRARFNEDRPFDREFAGIKRFEPVSLGQDSQVSLLHVGRNDAAGFFYYVMELADDIETGEEIFPECYVPKTLKEVRARQQRLPAEECLAVSLALARALAHLHVQGLVHRDIKPSNVIFVHGVPKLADIGLVSAIDTSNSFVGTEGFVPPEGPGSAAADVFSLGKVIYEISTGQDRNNFPKLPEDLETLEDKRALLELNEVVLKACDPDLQRRYATAESMREDLLLLQAGKSVRRLHVMERRFAMVAKYGVAATFITALAIGGFLWASGQIRQTKENLQRAQRAEADAIGRLHEAKLNWVRANRLTGRPGQRFASLVELARAATGSNRLDLRNEAIACVSLPDLRPLKQWDTTPDWYSLDFSPSFRVYATKDDQGNLTVRDTATDVVRYQLPGQGARLIAAIASPDERFLATSDIAGRAQLWDLRTRTPRPIAFPRGAKLFNFTPDSRALVVRHHEGSLHFLGSTNALEQKSIPGPAGVPSFRFNRTGEMFFNVLDGQAFIHRTADGQPVRMLNAPADASDGIRYAAWHPDGRRIALAWMNSLGLWEVETGRQLSTFEGHEGMMTELAFTDTGEWLVSTSWDRTTRLWHTDAQREALRLPDSGNGVRLSVDSSRLAFNSWDGRWVHLYEVAVPRAVQRFTLPPPTRHAVHHTMQTAFSPGGELVAAVGSEGVYLFQPPNPIPLAHLPAEAHHTVQFQPDGGALLTSGTNGVRHWPMAWSADHAELRLGPPAILEPTRAQAIEFFELSRDGQWMVAATKERFLGFDPEKSDEAIRIDARIQPGYRPYLSPDGHLAASRVNSRTASIQIWNPRTGILITNLPGHQLQDAAFSPDGRWLACAAADATTFWRTEDWSPRHRIPQMREATGRGHVAFSSDGRVAAFNVADSETRLMVVETGEELATLPTGRLLNSLAFSPGGNRLAVVLEPGYFQLWNLRQLRQELAALNLDWPGTPLPPDRSATGKLHITVIPDAARSVNLPPSQPASQ